MQNNIDKQDIHECLEALHQGKTILYPTDTIWGIGCDATNEEAVQKVIDLKGDRKNKSFIILLFSDYQIESYVKHIPEVAYQLIEYAEKPLTLILSGAKNLAPSALASDGSIGIRVVKHDFCERLLQRFRKPIISTSANFGGDISPASFQEINPKLREKIDYVVQYGQNTNTGNKASTIIKLEEDSKVQIIRE